MATTKIWAIKDSLSRVVNYAKNPNKTIFDNLKQVLEYAENDEKTIADKEERTMYVTGVNCNRETALEEMIAVQNRFNKTTGNVAYHAYQSFKTGEVSPELAHKIGVELAEKMWSEHQVLVATHFNTGTYHNHFVVCSVNMFTGKKFNCNKGAYFRFRGLSDELCEKYNLTVIKNPKGITPRNIYFAEKRGEPTKYNLMRQAIDETMEMCVSYAQFKKVMYQKGYIIQNDYNEKYPTIKSINDKKATRMYHLGEEYLPHIIADKISKNPYYYQERFYNFINPNHQYRQKRGRYRGSFRSISKYSSLKSIYLYYCYLFGVYKQQNQYNTKVRKPLSPEMKREIRRLNMYIREMDLIAKHKLDSINDVEALIANTEIKIEETTEIRQKYRNKLRNCKDEKLIAEYKETISAYTKILQDYRKDIKAANLIIEDTEKKFEKIRIQKQYEKEQQEMKKNKKKNKKRNRDVI